jgi:hypothetical protein
MAKLRPARRSEARAAGPADETPPGAQGSNKKRRRKSVQQLDQFIRRWQLRRTTGMVMAVLLLSVLPIVVAAGLASRMNSPMLFAGWLTSVACIGAVLVLATRLRRTTAAHGSGEAPGKSPAAPTDPDLPATPPPPASDGKVESAPGAGEVGMLEVASTVADVCGHRTRVAGGQVYAATAVGRRHRRKEVVREDAFAIVSQGPELGAIAVADGLGSTRDAHVAAAIAAHRAAALGAAWASSARPVVWWEFAERLVANVSALLTDERYVAAQSSALGYGARDRRPRQRPPATTLALAVARRVADGLEVWWLVYGDAVVFKIDGTGWRALSAFEPHRLDSNTPALPGGPEALQHGQTKLGGPQLLLLTTDGFAELFAAEADQVGSAIKDALVRGVSAAKFSTIADANMPGLDDDKTVVVLAP